MKLHLGAVLYFDHEFAADPAPLAALVRRLAVLPGLRQWWATARSSVKPMPLELETLIAKVKAGATVTVGVESEHRDVTIVAATEPAAALSQTRPRAWKYDLVVGLGADQVAALGLNDVIAALCEFADAVGATAGIAVWSPSSAFARALALLASGNDLTPEQTAQITDAYYWRPSWGKAIRGPEWGTFLSAAHVATLAGKPLPAAKIIRLTSGGAFLQLTPEPFDVDHPPAALAELRTALAPVMPG